jgi:CRP-like cAMP-binding protein
MIDIMFGVIEPYLKGLRFRERHFDSGRPLFHRGDPVKDVHFVLAGSVHLVRRQPDGAFLILQRAGPGSILAEASLYSETYHCDAVAFSSTDTQTYREGIPQKAARDQS